MQASLKADALATFLTQLRVDAWSPGPSDVEQAAGQLRSLARGNTPALIGTAPAPEGVAVASMRELRAGPYRVVFGARSPRPLAAAEAARAAAADVVVEFASAHDAEHGQTAAPHAAIVVRSGLGRSGAFARQRDGQIEAYAGRHAEELLLLELWPGGGAGEPWRLVSEPPPQAQRNVVRARHYRFDEKAPSDAAVRQFMDQVFARIERGHRDLATAAPEPARDAAKPSYVGSRTCAACHTAAYVWWRQTPHARAYQTLVQRKRALDLDCIGCHVTGFEQPGGAALGHLDELTEVGCESCHGPGQAHVDNPGTKRGAVQRSVPESRCVACHDASHSESFRYLGKRELLLRPGHGR